MPVIFSVGPIDRERGQGRVVKSSDGASYFALRMILESACSAGDGPRGIIVIRREEEGKKWESFVQTRRGDLSSKWFRRLHGRRWRKRRKEAAVIIKDILKRLIPGLISKFFSPGCREGKRISPGEKNADVSRSGSRNVGSRRISNDESLCSLRKVDGEAEGGGQRDQIHEVRRRVCGARE